MKILVLLFPKKMKSLLEKNKGCKGFTLAEILAYVSILIVISYLATSVFLWVSQTSNKARAEREVFNNTRRAMEIMTHEIKEAKGIYTPNSIFSNADGQLSLETTNYLPAGENTSYIDFYLCQERLCLKKEGQDPIAITSDKVKFESLTFFQIATTSTAPSIQINIKANYKSPSPKPEYQFSTNATSSASLRIY